MDYLPDEAEIAESVHYCRGSWLSQSRALFDVILSFSFILHLFQFFGGHNFFITVITFTTFRAYFFFACLQNVSQTNGSVGESLGARP